MIINGTDYSDSNLLGTASADVITARDGSDTVRAGDGNDTVYGGVAAHATEAGGGSDDIDGGLGNDRLYGGGGNDTLKGGDGDDLLDGGRGEDELTGGAGADVFVIRRDAAFSTDTVTDFDLARDRIDVSNLGISDFETVQALFSTASTDGLSIDFTSNYYDNSVLFRGLTLDSLLAGHFIFSKAAVNDALAGGAYADDLFGGLGHDTLAGGDGGDRLFGGAGDDRLYGGSAVAPDAVGQGRDLLTGGDGNDQLFGGGDADTLSGGAGNDRLDGGAGDDTLTGGLGNDVFVLARESSGFYTDLATDFVSGQDKIDVSGLGISSFATVQALLRADPLSGDAEITVSYNYYDKTLELENAAVGALKATDFIFATAATHDTLTGSQYGDDLFGGFGNDLMVGAEGDDRLFGEAGNDRLYGATNLDPNAAGQGRDLLDGGDGNDQLFGGGSDDLLRGGAGNDLLAGGDGRDRLDGGAGIDTADYGASDEAVIVRLWTGVGAGSYSDAEGDRLAGIENLRGSAFDDRLEGDALANLLEGGQGNDRLDGGLGNDLLVGSLGNDTLIGGNGADTASYAGTAAAVIANLLTGAATGSAGADRLIGIENLTGGNGNDTLTGNAAANTLSGGAGNDLLTGGLGRDLLYGGAGADRFDFNAVGESAAGAARDVIADFAAVGQVTDRIDLATIDADAAAAGNQAFAFIGGAAFTAAGQLRVFAEAGNTIVAADVNGDRIADFQIQLTGLVTLDAADFLL